MQDQIINEQRFTENYIHWRRAKGYGPLRIAMELQARGITREMIAEQLDISDNAWFQQVQKVWHKYFKGNANSDFKLRAKQIRFLLHKGFTQEQIESVFENIDNESGSHDKNKIYQQ
jgi:regulatory protein